ncbi:putative enoyl-CoA hydratase echA8 [Variovorax sp. PBL-E5]|nr:putative enoyl-CoA hydratase echA8 [Variovorax sp. PBL-E5]
MRIGPFARSQRDTAMHYPDYESIILDRPAPRVLRITMSRGDMNGMDYQLHHDMGEIWRLIDDDPDTSVAIVTGQGRAFSAGSDFEGLDKIVDSHEWRERMWKDGRRMVENMIHMSKPVISAISGTAAGGGLVVALLADISVVGKTVKLVDPHTRIGVAAGDHAALIWPLLCSFAKAKYYLMLGEPILGEEAERIGLVTMAVDDDQVMQRALAIAERLVQAAPGAVRFTKYSMNNWLRMMWPSFDASLALEILGFSGPEAREGVAALTQRRKPRFDPGSAA